ncbi:hypothetical protein [Chloroflexus sp.]|uniref:hypothetical protein n=1 Tax=Chloroflexus sp. TaxID=1904827 RepID=UPI002ACD28E4|nr:hypothetical protein [Chloroflexus sp.]
MLPLRIYVSATCAVCQYTYELVCNVQRLRPHYPIEVIDLDDEHAQKPAFVFGTPTYVLGETIIALGNPNVDFLVQLLDRVMQL